MSVSTESDPLVNCRDRLFSLNEKSPVSPNDSAGKKVTPVANPCNVVRLLKKSEPKLPLKSFLSGSPCAWRLEYPKETSGFLSDCANEVPTERISVAKTATNDLLVIIHLN